MHGIKRFLNDTTPWSKRSIRWFWIAALLTLVMVILAYILLWFGVQGKVGALTALSGQGVSVLVTALAMWGAYRARRRDIEHKSPPPS